MAQPHVYRRFDPESFSRITVTVVHTTSAPAAFITPVRETLVGLGQGIRVYDVQSLSVHVEQSYAEMRWLAGVLSVFGTLALILAGVGLYGVIGYRVARRTREIGVRMALGARRTHVFRQVLTQGIVVVLVGITFGELLAVGVTGAIGSFQEGVRPTGITTHIAVALIWVIVALVATYVPATRAARVDPLVALRCEKDGP